MDPITSEIVGIVGLLFIRTLIAALIFALVAVCGLILSNQTQNPLYVVAAFPVAWALSLAWEFFVLVQLFTDVVHLYQLATA